MSMSTSAHRSGARPVSAHEFEFPRLGGGAPISLRDFGGSAVLVVNVASACGFTPQYRELQNLWEAKSDKGLVILGVPCNDFGRQEGGAEGEIASFCDQNYHVTFPMTGKVDIIGADRHPFYEWVRYELGDNALPKWNFHKYLVDRHGALAGSFNPQTAPLGPEILSRIRQALT